MNSNYNIVEFFLAYYTEHGHGSAQVKTVLLGFFLKKKKLWGKQGTQLQVPA